MLEKTEKKCLPLSIAVSPSICVGKNFHLHDKSMGIAQASRTDDYRIMKKKEKKKIIFTIRFNNSEWTDATMLYS